MKKYLFIIPIMICLSVLFLDNKTYATTNFIGLYPEACMNRVNSHPSKPQFQQLMVDHIPENLKTKSSFMNFWAYDADWNLFISTNSNGQKLVSGTYKTTPYSTSIGWANNNSVQKYTWNDITKTWTYNNIMSGPTIAWPLADIGNCIPYANDIDGHYLSTVSAPSGFKDSDYIFEYSSGIEYDGVINFDVIGKQVVFDISQVNPAPTSYTIDYGDGNTGNSLTHIYDDPGEKTVEFTFNNGILKFYAYPIIHADMGNIHLKANVSSWNVALSGSQVADNPVTFNFDFISGNGTAFKNYETEIDPNVSYYSIDGYQVQTTTINGNLSYEIQLNYEYDHTLTEKRIYMKTTDQYGYTKTIYVDVNLGAIGTTSFENDGTNPELYTDPVPQVPDIGDACSVQQDWPFFDFAACASSIKQTFELVLIDGQDLKSIAAGAPSGCYTLRVIDDWLFLPNQYVCPRFNDTIRNILTPFIILAFGLMGIRFLAHGTNGRDY